MGLIRKSLMVGTVGVVHGSSKKQRVAKATMQSSAATAQAAAAVARATSVANQLAQQRADEEREFRYASDPVYRQWVDNKRAAEEAQRRAVVAQQALATQMRRDELRAAKQRRQARNLRIKEGVTASVSHVAAMTFAAVAVAVLAVLVWAPQLGIAKMRRTHGTPWMMPQLKALSVRRGRAATG